MTNLLYLAQICSKHFEPENRPHLIFRGDSLSSSHFFTHSLTHSLIHSLNHSQTFLLLQLFFTVYLSHISDISQENHRQFSANIWRISGISQTNPRKISGQSQANIRHIWVYIRHISYISKKNFMEISGNSHGNLIEILVNSLVNLRHISNISQPYLKHI